MWRAETVRPSVSGRPPVAVVADADAAQDPQEELDRLLARRLRQLFAILAVIYLLFLVRDEVMRLTGSVGWTWQRTALLLTGGVVQGTLAVAAYRKPNASRRWYAAAEVVTLLTCWTIQGLNQLASLANSAGWGELITHPLGQVVLADVWQLQWFALIAGYPVLVPNAIRRTAVIVTVTAVMPILVTVLASALNPELTLAWTWLMYVQYLLWGLVGVSIAVYGASQAALLRRQVFEAKQFGQYRLLRKLGRGGMGDVFLAEHRLLRRPSVIKLIRPDRTHDPRTVRRFEREVRMLATLTHWNTVEVYDYGHTPDGTFYFVMEYLPGQNLQRMVDAHGPLPHGRVVYLLAQVCRGLREAHGVGLIHRDIKPANVMACQRGGLPDVAKLLDFGLVQSPEDAPDSDSKLTRDGMVMGTPAFLSPEQASARPTDARSDVYSLGCTAFFLLTGRAPFVGETMADVIAAHLLTPPPDPRAVRQDTPSDLAAVVLRCMAKAPADRFADVRELETALRSCGCAAGWTEELAADWWRTHSDPA